MLRQLQTEATGGESAVGRWMGGATAPGHAPLGRMGSTRSGGSSGSGSHGMVLKYQPRAMELDILTGN